MAFAVNLQDKIQLLCFQKSSGLQPNAQAVGARFGVRVPSCNIWPRFHIAGRSCHERRVELRRDGQTLEQTAIPEVLSPQPLLVVSALGPRGALASARSDVSSVVRRGLATQVAASAPPLHTLTHRSTAPADPQHGTTGASTRGPTPGFMRGIRPRPSVIRGSVRELLQLPHVGIVPIAFQQFLV